MKATGIVRRMDDLGRVVVPSEIRRNMMISEGDMLEIFVDQDGIMFKKYYPKEAYGSGIGDIIKMMMEEYDPSYKNVIKFLEMAVDALEEKAE